MRFADIRDEARVVSSKAFCPLNFRITDRNLSGNHMLYPLLLIYIDIQFLFSLIYSNLKYHYHISHLKLITSVTRYSVSKWIYL